MMEAGARAMVMVVVIRICFSKGYANVALYYFYFAYCVLLGDTSFRFLLFEFQTSLSALALEL